MDIIKARQEERKQRIQQIQNSIIQAGDDIDYRKLEMVCSTNWGIALRSIKEYVKIARFNVENANQKRDTEDAKADSQQLPS